MIVVVPWMWLAAYSSSIIQDLRWISIINDLLIITNADHKCFNLLFLQIQPMFIKNHRSTAFNTAEFLL